MRGVLGVGLTLTVWGQVGTNGSSRRDYKNSYIMSQLHPDFNNTRESSEDESWDHVGMKEKESGDSVWDSLIVGLGLSSGSAM